MKKVVLKRIFHRDDWRYAIFFSYDNSLTEIARKIPGALFSGSNKCWYTDNNEASLREILSAFRDVADIDISAIATKREQEEQVSSISGRIREDQTEKVSAKPDEYHTPKGERQEKASGSVGQASTSNEVLPVDDSDEEIHVDKMRVVKKFRYDPVEFRISETSGRLTVKFTGRYTREWIDELNTYGRVYYDKVHKEFLLQWSQITCDSLSDYFSRQLVPVRVIKTKVDKVTLEQRKLFSDEIRSRELSEKGIQAAEILRQHLEQNRYSSRTIESYMALIGLFFKYFNDKDPGRIKQNDVTEFMTEFIIKNGFSASYQNQMVSAIKMYNEVAGRGRATPVLLERPRRGRALPKVFSKEEVIRILSSGRNNKHKLLLWMIYSCGLRRSEVTNIRIDDIDRTRNIIHIREGKGMVDRIVPVPDKIWPKLDDYLAAYSPADYLFEGQKGRRYSVESVYQVFRQALKRAGIKKDVGVHSLRHSYATHLHENGLDIRYIQELLGHKSTRTTEIYTHVSRRNLISVRSPIEDLDIK